MELPSSEEESVKDIIKTSPKNQYNNLILRVDGSVSPATSLFLFANLSAALYHHLDSSVTPDLCKTSFFAACFSLAFCIWQSLISDRESSGLHPYSKAGFFPNCLQM